MKETVIERPVRHRRPRTAASRTVAQTLALFLALPCTALAVQQEPKAAAKAKKAQKMKKIEAKKIKGSPRPTRPAPQPCGGRLGEGREAYVQQWSEPCEYTFAGQRGQYFLLNLEASPDFVPSLRLIAPDGAYLRPLSDPLPDGKAWQLPRGGDYKLRVGSVVTNHSGAHVPGLTPEAKGVEGRLIISGSTQNSKPTGFFPRLNGCVGGTIASGSLSKTLSSGTGSCRFKYIGMPDDSLTIRVTSTEVDPKVEVSLDGTVLAMDDDGGRGSNSLISDLALTQGGAYRIVVSSRDSADGDFTLELEQGDVKLTQVLEDRGAARYRLAWTCIKGEPWVNASFSGWPPRGVLSMFRENDGLKTGQMVDENGAAETIYRWSGGKLTSVASNGDVRITAQLGRARADLCD